MERAVRGDGGKELPLFRTEAVHRRGDECEAGRTKPLRMPIEVAAAQTGCWYGFERCPGW
jgi:hypothetical protein